MTFPAKRLLAGLAAFLISMTALGAGEAAPLLAILDFQDATGALPGEGAKLALLLCVELSKGDGLRLLEREQLQKTFDERDLGASGMADASRQLDLGRLLGADYVLSGRFYSVGGERFFNGKLLRCSDSSVSGVSEPYPASLAKDAALKALSAKLAKFVEGRIGSSSVRPGN